MSKVKRSKLSSEEMSSSSCSSSSLTSDEETDAQDLKPIKGYLSNRRELAKQLFKSVKSEKIRMMLPQALKRVNLGELEEWCASELSGMSKTRILCILSGKAMDDSSDTSESDNSGPSLEIISDTEEWFTDEDTIKKDDGLGSGQTKGRKGKLKVKNKLHTKGDIDKCKSKGRFNNKPDDKFKDIKIKTENENNKNKEKDGDSLLDLLELEMRARAIRALIRKEEDIIPSTDGSKTIKSDQRSNNNGANKAMQDDQKEKENCRRQIEKIISAHHGGNEDEDVVLVVQPTPTIELLSSDSDADGHNTSRVNQRLENERTAMDNKSLNDKTIRTGSQKDTKVVVNKEKEDVGNKQNGSSITLTSNEVPTKSVEEKKKKLNKRSHTKDHSKSTKSGENSTLKSGKGDTQEDSKLSEIVEHTSTANDVKLQKPLIIETKVQLEETKQPEVQKLKKTVTPDEEKSIDMDEIIDLDDYSDDMEDIENYGSNKHKSQKAEVKDGNVSREVAPAQKPNSSETWASRYYQTDDVQSVIKESKIQSEIRKRLRERQRLSKLNKSPSTSSPTSSSLPEATMDTCTQKPTGSVDEYLALKRSGSINTNSESENNNSNMSEDKSQPSDSCHDMDTTTTTGASAENKLDTENISTSSDVNDQSCTEAVEVNNITNPI